MLIKLTLLYVSKFVVDISTTSIGPNDFKLSNLLDDNTIFNKFEVTRILINF